MDDATLRQLVREAVGRHLALAAPSAMPPSAWAAAPRAVPPFASADAPFAAPVAMRWHGHVSHHQFALPPSEDGACIVEPAVRCTHCGFCQSMGH